MQKVIVIVGFLGAGKTTLLKKMVNAYLDQKWHPFIILNDYQNADLDTQQFLNFLEHDQVHALNGSCICCKGVQEFRTQINSVPKIENGIVLVEANGTTDAHSLMGFLGVGLKDHLAPPIQISVVDVRHWQKRGLQNALEANQVQTASLIVLSHTKDISQERRTRVLDSIQNLNPVAEIVPWDDFDTKIFDRLVVREKQVEKIRPIKTLWSSCSVDLPDPLSSEKLEFILESLPDTILRAKGCTRLDNSESYSFFEKIPSGDISIRDYNGTLVSGPKLLVIGPGSDPKAMNELIHS